jgi:hypothetical protein
VIEEAKARSELTEERWPIAELLRIKGELLLLQGAPTVMNSSLLDRGNTASFAKTASGTKEPIDVTREVVGLLGCS